MRQPPYQLRPNKAVDRLTLIDAIRQFRDAHDLREYTYYGMGGPWLEDFRLIYDFYPEIRMVSIESDENVYRRQQFHIPCHRVRLDLKRTEFNSFLASFGPEAGKSIFWLDYLWLRYAHIDEFMTLLGKVPADSMIKISLRCEPKDYLEDKKRKEFQREFEDVLPHPSVEPPVSFADLAKLVQEMIQIAAQKALSSAMPFKFVPVSSFCYADGAGMFTLTGIVCRRTDESKVKSAFRSWDLRNLSWGTPRLIDVPTLSTKERLHLQRQLPRGNNAGRTLLHALGYLIEDDRPQTEARLQQYADFHHYFPYFMKAIP
jgi:hypothetical protein